MHFLMTALGSYGDVHPIVGLGGALRERGHQVSIISNPHFRPVVESVAAEFLPLGTEEEYLQFKDTPDVWHPIKGPLIVMREGVVPYLNDLFALIEANYRPGGTVLVAHPLDLASRVMQEKHQAKLANVFLAPMLFRTMHETPRMGKLLTGRWVPRWLKRLQFWFADQLVDRILGPPLNELRRQQGLASPARGIFRDWWFSPDLVLGIFPEWFGPAQPDWPRQLRLVGFPLWDQPDQEGLPAEVGEFLRAGEPPLVFTPGSAMAHGEEFFQAAVEACRLLDRRGILLSKYTEHLPADLPEEVRHFGFVPLSQLLPRAAAFVHHGGIGSCGQGLSAGLPQLIMPMAFDQPDNAARLKRLGVAESLPRNKFRGPAVAKSLERLLADPKVHQQCHYWAQQCDGQVSLDKACESLENLAIGDK